MAKVPLSGFEEAVSAFQTKVGAPPPSRITRVTQHGQESDLLAASVILRQLSTKLKETFKKTRDQRFLRAELMIEELSEAVSAMHDRDEIGLLDGLADLLYVVVGSATCFDLPLEEAFWEVHRSNMTKHKAAADHQGDKGKGPAYSPPDLSAVLKQHLAREV